MFHLHLQSWHLKYININSNINCINSNPEWFTFLAVAYPGCPGKEAVKWE